VHLKAVCLKRLGQSGIRPKGRSVRAGAEAFFETVLVMATDLDARPRAWLYGSVLRAASDACLGAVLLIAGAVAIWNAASLGLGSASRLGSGDYPRVLGWLSLVIGIAALLRAAVLRNVDHARWSLTSVALITALVLAAQFAPQQWLLRFGPPEWLLQFGPAEFVTILLLTLAVAIALARASRIRAIGMALLGLMIAAIGIDVNTGIFRFTMGLDSLADGITISTVVLGFIVADGSLCVLSPSLLLASYARKVGHRLAVGPRLLVDLLLRVAGVLLVAAAFYAAYVLEGSGWPVGQIVAFAAFGIACQIFDWNRLVLLIALALGPLLEENIMRTLVIARGDLTIYFNRPIVGTVLLLGIVILLVAAVLSVWSMLAGRRPASG
jgi:hypothetical protein